jgi:hypothetical protein
MRPRVIDHYERHPERPSLVIEEWEPSPEALTPPADAALPDGERGVAVIWPPPVDSE